MLTCSQINSIQRYEGASTLYGPHTLAAYINVTLSWVSSLGSSAEAQPPRGPEPPDNSNRSLSFIPSVILDSAPFFKKFGDVVRDAEGRAYQKGETVTVKFVGANPRNNLRLGESYAVLEKLVTATAAPPSAIVDIRERGLEYHENAEDLKEAQTWQVVRDDNDWHLVFRWRRVSELLGTSEVTIMWETTDPWAETGTYRIRYFGDAKSLGGKITPFEGASSAFRLVE